MDSVRDSIRILTVRQPWAGLIIEGWKEVENRSWTTGYRGPILIHAAKQIDRKAMQEYPGYQDAPRGEIIGQVELVDIASESSSPWYREGNSAWILKSPRKFPQPIPFNGRLGLVEIGLDDELRAAMSD